MHFSRNSATSSQNFTLSKNKNKKSILSTKTTVQQNILWVELFGGLGNTLFQIATGYALSKKFNYKLYFINPKYNPHKTCNYKKTFYKQLIFSDPLKNSIKIKEKHEQQYNNIILPKGSIILFGYWQCPEYFNEYKNDIKKLLGFENIDITSNTVTLHVRRGDYLKISHIHPICSINYYKKAAEIIGFDKIYNIFSDDIDWCKNNLNFLPNKNFIVADEVETFHIMIQSEFFIIANSTFSWWAAYLGIPKKVIAPKPWINTLDSNIYCNDWVKIDI